MPDVRFPATEVEQPSTTKRKRLARRPSLRSLTVTTLPSYLSPFPLPSKLSARLHALCGSGDAQLLSLVDGLRSKELDVDDWQRRLWSRVSDDWQPNFQQTFEVRAHYTHRRSTPLPACSLTH